MNAGQKTSKRDGPGPAAARRNGPPPSPRVAKAERPRSRPSASWRAIAHTVPPPAPVNATAGLRHGGLGDVYEREADAAAEHAVHPLARGGPQPVVPSRPPSRTPLWPGGHSVSPGERRVFEQQFSHDFGAVRLHDDVRAAGIADALNADAVTIGHDIFFGTGKRLPPSGQPNRLLAHELAHVVQQSRMGLALQPKLKITGRPADVSRAMALLNGGMIGHQVSVNNTGNVTLGPSGVAGPPTTQQQALFDRLTTVINDPADVVMTVSSGSATLGGSYATGNFDIADLEVYGVGGLMHEIEEQYQKQVKGLAFGSETTGAHAAAISAESEVTGAQRGPQRVVSSTPNADGTMNAVVEIPWTFPNGQVKIQTLNVVSNNIVSTTWR